MTMAHKLSGAPVDQGKMTTHKSKLLARLTEAREYGLAKKDKRSAAQLALDAFLEWARAEDIPPEQMQLLVGLGSALHDLNLGKHPELLKPSPRPGPGSRGIETEDKVNFAIACAAVEVLPEHEVARTIGMPLGAFQSRRKAFSAGRRGSEARDAYHEALKLVRGLKPQEMRRLLAKRDWAPK